MHTWVLPTTISNKNTNPRLKVGSKVNVPTTAVTNITECFYLFGYNAESEKHGSCTQVSMVIQSTWHKLYYTRISLQHLSALLIQCLVLKTFISVYINKYWKHNIQLLRHIRKRKRSDGSETTFTVQRKFVKCKMNCTQICSASKSDDETLLFYAKLNQGSFDCLSASKSNISIKVVRNHLSDIVYLIVALTDLLFRDQ